MAVRPFLPAWRSEPSHDDVLLPRQPPPREVLLLSTPADLEAGGSASWVGHAAAQRHLLWRPAVHLQAQAGALPREQLEGDLLLGDILPQTPAEVVEGVQCEPPRLGARGVGRRRVEVQAVPLDAHAGGAVDDGLEEAPGPRDEVHAAGECPGTHRILRPDPERRLRVVESFEEVRDAPLVVLHAEPTYRKHGPRHRRTSWVCDGLVEL
mmetsp:Transcript_90137/g.263568  ORF Transcript_90137/g.263568 Transcript_90137/m.263568 type:complete len:209 (-) Transcript_90137:179-805(-)